MVQLWHVGSMLLNWSAGETEYCTVCYLAHPCVSRNSARVSNAPRAPACIYVYTYNGNKFKDLHVIVEFYILQYFLDDLPGCVHSEKRQVLWSGRLSKWHQLTMQTSAISFSALCGVFLFFGSAQKDRQVIRNGRLSADKSSRDNCINMFRTHHYSTPWHVTASYYACIGWNIALVSQIHSSQMLVYMSTSSCTSHPRASPHLYATLQGYEVSAFSFLFF